MNRLLRTLLLVFVISNSAFAQENVRLNIIVTINNTLVDAGKLDFIIGDEKKDTIHSEYNMGEVYLKDSDYVKLSLAEKCDIVYKVDYMDVDSDAGIVFPIRERYFIHSVEKITDFKFFIITLYKKKKRKKIDYIGGFFGKKAVSYVRFFRTPKTRKEDKLFWDLIKGISGTRYS